MPGPARDEQRDFYSRRMAEELARAERADDDGLRHLHLSWAREYRRRLETFPDGELSAGEARRRRADARGLGSWTTDLG